MCRKKKECSELTTNHEQWSKTAPLPPPNWFESQLEIFQEAVEQFISGNKEQFLLLLSKVRDVDIKNWCGEHGQISGYHRARQIKYPKPVSLENSLRYKPRSPKKYEETVFLRDGFRCRYCGTRVISKKFLDELIKTLNSEVFQKGRRNNDNHGIIHAFKPVADHVIPWRIGGETTLENLVTSCGPCNYGKDRFTIEQLDITNPLDRNPIKDEWDGLSSKIDAIKKIKAY